MLNLPDMLIRQNPKKQAKIVALVNSAIYIDIIIRIYSIINIITRSERDGKQLRLLIQVYNNWWLKYLIEFMKVLANHACSWGLQKIDLSKIINLHLVSSLAPGMPLLMISLSKFRFGIRYVCCHVGRLGRNLLRPSLGPITRGIS